MSDEVPFLNEATLDEIFQELKSRYPTLVVGSIEKQGTAMEEFRTRFAGSYTAVIGVLTCFLRDVIKEYDNAQVDEDEES